MNLGTGNGESNSSSFSRKSAKATGIDKDEARKQREQVTIQLRKIKRSERANLQRRKLEVVEDENYGDDHVDNDIPLWKQSNRPPKHLDDIPIMREKLFSDSIESQIEGATYFRRILAIEKVPPVEVVVDSGVVPRIIFLLNRHDCHQLQHELCWIVTNIACGEPHHTQLMIQQGVIEALRDVISVAPENVCDQAMWALGNISGDSAESRNHILASGIVERLLWHLGINNPPGSRIHGAPSLSTMKYVVWITSNLLRTSPPPPREQVSAILLATSELLHSPVSEVLVDACKTVQHISEYGSGYVLEVIQHGILARLAELASGGRFQSASHSPSSGSSSSQVVHASSGVGPVNISGGWATQG